MDARLEINPPPEAPEAPAPEVEAREAPGAGSVAVEVPKYRVIAEALKQRIANGEFAAHEKLPTQRELMDEHGVALMTVRQAITELKQSGYVSAHPGRGTFVTARGGREWHVQPGERSVGVGMIRSRDWIAYESSRFDARLAASAELAGQHRFDVRMRGFRPEQVEAVGDWAEQLQGLILWGEVTWQLAEHVRDAGVATVVCGEMVGGACPPGVSWANVDERALVEMPLDYLAGLGHRRVALIAPEQRGYPKQVAAHLQAQAADPSRAMSIEPCWYPEPEPQDWAQRIAELETDPTALFVLGSDRGVQIVHALREAGVSVPGRFSVLATSHDGIAQLPMPTLSTIYVPGVEAFQQSVAMLSEMLDHGHVGRRFLPPRMRYGKTCGPVESEGTG